MTNEAKFTFGPWTAHEAATSFFIRGRDGATVAGCHNGHKAANRERSRINSYLIAAAPELYEALERCEQMVSTDNGPPDWDWVRSVLSKARGE